MRIRDWSSDMCSSDLTKENDISKCTKSVLNNGKWAKYGKNRENRKYSSN